MGYTGPSFTSPTIVFAWRLLPSLRETFVVVKHKLGLSLFGVGEWVGGVVVLVG